MGNVLSSDPEQPTTSAPAVETAVGTTSIGGPLALIGGTAGGFAAAKASVAAAVAGGMVAGPFVGIGFASIVIGCAVYLGMNQARLRREANMDWKARNKRYRHVLWKLLGKASANRAWEHLTAEQLEATLVKQLQLPNVDLLSGTFDDIDVKGSKYFKEDARFHFNMVMAMHELRCCLSRSCFIAVVGPQNAGKSILIKKMWQQDVENTTIDDHTEKATIYQVETRLQVRFQNNFAYTVVTINADMNRREKVYCSLLDMLEYV